MTTISHQSDNRTITAVRVLMKRCDLNARHVAAAAGIAHSTIANALTLDRDPLVPSVAARLARWVATNEKATRREEIRFIAA